MTDNAREKPEPEEVNAYTTDDQGRVIVILRPEDCSLPDLLRHIEAGRIVRVVSTSQPGEQP
ncbi:hypothetical protein HII36_02225 [Nonomuraea sp. NN258]|uniref:hypothetical protein n=1 Tax=Nonomuraea antri TaxID=2730852 RepID=UPI00156A4C90|nr:hypothetical protein [Nonomuraea antri]NRQ30659.1 hypothetical protein [Nonomuraea antri]